MRESVSGTLYQENLPDNEKWFMPIPLVMTYGGDKLARGTIAVLGKESPFTVRVPAIPHKVELDPDLFILSLKTSAHKEN